MDQNHTLTPLEKCQFFDFLNFLILYPERRFFVLEYHKRHFPGLYYQKRKSWKKLAFLNQNHGLTPLEKCQFFDFLNFFFLHPRKAFFRFKISLKTFSWPILPKKKIGTMAIFGPKQWVNFFGKMSIFRLFELLVFIA